MELININKIFNNKHNKVQALKNINLKIDNKGITCIVGPSGCGKTTLLGIMSKKEKDYSGEIKIDGTVEIINQEIMLMEAMSVIDNLLLINKDIKQIETLLEHFKMLEFSKQKVKKLSLGQKKRIQIIRSLLLHPAYLLCDEPTSALDNENATLIMDMLKAISKDRCVIIVTHEIALVDNYADRIINIKSGIIVDDRIIQEKAIIEQPSQLRQSHNILEHMNFAFKNIKARPFETVLNICLICIMIISMFTSTSLFRSVDQANAIKEKWKNSENIIITQPNEGNDTIRKVDKKNTTDIENKNNDFFYYYDIYDKESIALVKDNVDGIIGYQCGWEDRFSLGDPSSFIPNLTIDGLRELVKDGERIKEATNAEPFNSFEFNKQQLQEIENAYPNESFPKDKVITIDFRNYEGFARLADGAFNIPLHSNRVYFNESQSDYLTPYQLFSDSKLSLQYGKKPANDSEVIIALNTATLLSKYNKLNSEANLIGKKIPIFMTGMDSSARKIAEVTISGITYESSRNEYQVYFKNQAWDHLIENNYQINTDKIKYQFINFLVDESLDSKQVVKKIMQVLPGKESHFIVASDITYEMKGYQNPANFYLFAFLSFLGLAILYIVVRGFTYQRTKKENNIIQRYGYSVPLIIGIQLLSVFIVCILVEAIMFPYICDTLNAFANQMKYATIMDNDVMKLLISALLVLITTLIIEGVYYATAIRKNK